MRRVVVLAVIAAVLLSILSTAGIVGTAVAQTDNNTTDTPTETPASDAEDDVRDLWTVYADSREQANQTTADDANIIRSIGPNVWVTGAEFHSDNTADITITTQRTISLTFTDSSAIDPSQESGTFRQETITIPRGTYTVHVAATVDDDGNQLVTIVGGQNNIWVSNGDTDSGGILPSGGSRLVAFGGGFVAVLGTTVFLGLRKRRKDERKQERVV